MKNKNWTINNLPDLKDKIIIVTGGNSGLGYESVKAFAGKGATVILACRDLGKGEAAKNEIEKNGCTGPIDVRQLDLTDFASISNFAEGINKDYDRMDVLMNNAGIMTSPYFLTKDGLEAQNGINHFGHFALTGQLLELINKTPGSRIVNVSSGAHKWGKMDFNNPLFENGKDYTPMKSYARSKLSNLLFTYELQRRFEAKKIKTIAVAAHPGGSRTNLSRYMEKKLLFRFIGPLFYLMSQSQGQGALPQIRAAVDSNVEGAEYYGPDGFQEMKGYPVLVESNAASHSQQDALKLWALSEELTGIKYLGI